MPPSRAAASSVALATALCLAPRAAAMPSYRYKVPNGDRVACPPGAAGRTIHSRQQHEYECMHIARSGSSEIVA